jgi:hypothetical protein
MCMIIFIKTINMYCIKIIDGFEGKFKIDTNGVVYFSATNKKVSQNIGKRGYSRVTMMHPCGKVHNFQVHRLVAAAFIPNPDGKETVNHIDGNKQNNCLENLEWNTRSENMIHAYKNGSSIFKC